MKRRLIMLFLLSTTLLSQGLYSLWKRDPNTRYIVPALPPYVAEMDSGFFKYLYTDSFSSGSIVLSPMAIFDSLTVNYWFNLSNHLKMYVDSDTVVFWSDYPIRIDSLIGGGGNQGWTMGCGDTLVGISSDCADSFYLFDDGDTTRLISDNPIKIGNSSFIITDSYNMSNQVMSVGIYPPSGLSWLEAYSEDTMKVNAILSLASATNPAINWNVWINDRVNGKSGIFVAVDDSITDTLSDIRLDTPVNLGGVAIGLYADIVPSGGGEEPSDIRTWSIFVSSSSAPSFLGTLYGDTMYYSRACVDTIRTDRLTIASLGDSTVIEDVVYIDSSLYIVTSSPVNDTFIINGKEVFVDTVIDTISVGICPCVYTYGTTNNGDKLFQEIQLDTTGSFVTHSLLPLQGDTIVIDSIKAIVSLHNSPASGDSLQVSLLKMANAFRETVLVDTIVGTSIWQADGVNFILLPCNSYKTTSKSVAVNVYYWSDNGLNAIYAYRGVVVYYKSYTIRR